MALPTPPAERGTRIVFVGSSKDELLTVDVDQKPPGVELSGRIAQLTRDGLPIWGEPRERALHGARQGD
jgi:hypothetical protein